MITGLAFELGGTSARRLSQKGWYLLWLISVDGRLIFAPKAKKGSPDSFYRSKSALPPLIEWFGPNASVSGGWRHSFLQRFGSLKQSPRASLRKKLLLLSSEPCAKAGRLLSVIADSAIISTLYSYRFQRH